MRCVKTPGAGRKTTLTVMKNEYLQALTEGLYPPVAQLDNAADSDSEDRGFESLRAGQKSTVFDRRLSILLFCIANTTGCAGSFKKL